jgi:hypothetical protein
MKYPNLRKTGRADYTKPSASRTKQITKTPWGDIWINSNPLRTGTSKLHDVYTFDLLPILGCINHKACSNNCYALNGQRMRPDVYNMRLIHTYLARERSAVLNTMLDKSIDELSCKSVVRPHASGDFFGEDYAQRWSILMRYHKDKTFYTYSKSKSRYIYHMNELPNVNIIPSDEPFNGRNFAPMTEVLDFISSPQGRGWTICPATLDSSLKCNKDCRYCIEKGNRKIVFVQHR